jgi:TonB family protein
VDRTPGFVRNSGVEARARQRPVPDSLVGTSATPAQALMVDVVALTDDLELFDAIRDAVGERNPVRRIRSAEESVDLMLAGRCGVFLIDTAAVTAQPDTLVEQIVDQFPDVVVVVAGRREDEPVLAGLISDGLVYRFMHKPLSPKRAGMFLNAAIRSHAERRVGRAGVTAAPLVRELRSRVDPRKWLFVGGGLVAFIALLAATLVARYGTPSDPGPAADASRTTLPAAPLADPVLSRARAALAAGRYEAPPGRNALDLYSAVLLTRPDDLEARRGLETTTARLVEDAERAAAAGDGSEARRIARRVLQADAGHAGAHAVLDHLERPTPAAPAIAEPAVAPVANAVRADEIPPQDLPAATATTPDATHAAAPLRPEDLSRLDRVPVTRLDPPVPAARPAVPRVQADPLAPRIVGSGQLPTSPSRRSRPTAARYIPGPAAPALPTAGYAQPQADVADGRAAPPATAEPGVQQRDLEPVATPGPDYPPAAYQQGVAGWVEVEYTVNESGATTDVVVVAGEPPGVFDAAATAAVARWKYRPRVVNGRPVAQRTSVTLRFEVER